MMPVKSWGVLGLELVHRWAELVSRAGGGSPGEPRSRVSLLE